MSDTTTYFCLGMLAGAVSAGVLLMVYLVTERWRSDRRIRYRLESGMTLSEAFEAEFAERDQRERGALP